MVTAAYYVVGSLIDHARPDCAVLVARAKERGHLLRPASLEIKPTEPDVRVRYDDAEALRVRPRAPYFDRCAVCFA